MSSTSPAASLGSPSRSPSSSAHGALPAQLAEGNSGGLVFLHNFPRQQQQRPATSMVDNQDTFGSNISPPPSSCFMSARNQNQGPILRSMSDATECRRPFASSPSNSLLSRVNPYYHHMFGESILGGGSGELSTPGASNNPYVNVMMNRRMQMCNVNSQSGNSTTAAGVFGPAPPPPQSSSSRALYGPAPPPGLGMMRQAQSGNSTAKRNETEDEDYDLNMVFDEIGAIQSKGLDETEDDQSTEPLQSSISTSLPTQSMLTQLHVQNKKQHHSHHLPVVFQGVTVGGSGKHVPLSSPTTTANKPQYDLAIYDPADLDLVNEKFPSNVQ